tara:strand:- start:4864 stop:5517 length:654 start_codon:yes stop_codon:yes gene_type:complete
MKTLKANATKTTKKPIIQRLRTLNVKHIALDLDDTICPFFPPFKEYLERKNKTKTNAKINCSEYNFSKIFKINDLESKVLVSNFYDSPEFNQISPYIEAVKAIEILRKEGYKLSIVTGRQNYAETQTKQFIESFIPNTFEDVHLTNSFSLEGEELSKYEICKSINADILIDDNIRYCEECSSKNITALVYGEYPWNKNSVHERLSANWEMCYHNKNP